MCRATRRDEIWDEFGTAFGTTFWDEVYGGRNGRTKFGTKSERNLGRKFGTKFTQDEMAGRNSGQNRDKIWDEILASPNCSISHAEFKFSEISSWPRVALMRKNNVSQRTAGTPGSDAAGAQDVESTPSTTPRTIASEAAAEPPRAAAPRSPLRHASGARSRHSPSSLTQFADSFSQPGLAQFAGSF